MLEKDIKLYYEPKSLNHLFHTIDKVGSHCACQKVP